MGMLKARREREMGDGRIERFRRIKLCLRLSGESKRSGDWQIRKRRRIGRVWD